jgi:hypothetical protein
MTIGMSLLLLVLAPALSAQPERARPGMVAWTIHGTVTDSSGTPLPGADVYLEPARRSVTAGAGGTFRFTLVKPGEYTLAVRRLGMAPLRLKVQVDSADVRVNVVMHRLVPVLPVHRSIAAAGGITGVVVDSTDAPIVGAEVVASPSQVRTVTDSTGAFFLPVPGGKHMLRASKPGSGARMLSVTVPPDSGRRVHIQVIAALSSARIQAQLSAFRERWIRRSPVGSSFHTYDDIASKDWETLEEYLSAAAGRPVDPSCLVALRSESERKPVYAIDLHRVEAIELQLPRQTTRPSRIGSSFCPSVSVWLRN